jgi:hypothetical protein
MLTKEQISDYYENGYLLVEDVVTPEQLQRMQDITHEFIDSSTSLTQSMLGTRSWTVYCSRTKAQGS